MVKKNIKTKMKKLISKENALSETPKTGDKWKNLSEKERIDSLKSVLNAEEVYKSFKVKAAKNDGQVSLKIEDSLPVDVRGLFLLQLEKKFKTLIDKGISLWLEPVGDKNKLRKLRGVVFSEDVNG